jgi:hypothetical protein
MQRTIHRGKEVPTLPTFYTVEKEDIADFCMISAELCI